MSSAFTRESIKKGKLACRDRKEAREQELSADAGIKRQIF